MNNRLDNDKLQAIKVHPSYRIRLSNDKASIQFQAMDHPAVSIADKTAFLWLNCL